VTRVKLHVKALHEKSNAKKFPCLKCPFIFKSELEMYGHYLNDHMGLNADPLKCIFCEFRGTSVTKLESHLTKHTGERPYFCKVCPMGFGSSDNLIRHIKSSHKTATPK